MPTNLDENTTSLIKDLIHQITGFNDGSQSFRRTEKFAFRNIQMADSLYFSNRIEVDSVIESLGNKFTLHGFTSQAQQLKYLYEKLVPSSIKRQELSIRLNIIKFILGVSQSPTNNFHKYCANLRSFESGDSNDAIDWPNYLQEGIERWSPPPCETSDSWTDSSDSTIEESDITDNRYHSINKQTYGPKTEDIDILSLYRSSKTSLCRSIQSKWFNTDTVVFKPISQDRDANVALLWDNFINNKTWGLLPQPSTSIISEYKVIREILWQFYQPHTSSCFSLDVNKIIPSKNITISSVRYSAFESMLSDFIPFITWFEVFRAFDELLIKSNSDSVTIPPDTYKSYYFGIQSILNPIFNSLRLIEDKVKCQETTSTLLTLAQELNLLLHTVKVLHSIHSKVILDFNDNSPLECATTLLWRLRNGLLYTSSKLEQDLYLTLYLHSLYKYLTIINSWLSRDEFEDHAGEFVISDENPKDLHVLLNKTFSKSTVNTNIEQQNRKKPLKGEQDWNMEFIVKDTPSSDGMLNIIGTQVLQIGKNIHLLRLLGKLHLVSEFTGKSNETLHKAFTRRVLERIADFFGPLEDCTDAANNIPEPISESSSFIFPAICPDGCKYFTEMDKLENLVDTSDGFLIKAFESFFIKRPEYKSKVQEKTLFENISEITTDFLPAYQIVEDVFLTVLKERYRISGIMVKNVLINDHHLTKQLSFLKHIFLFEDDLIFLVYRHIFDELDSGCIWVNRAQLTSHLHDIIMDLYPNFYDECLIEIKDSCQYTKDPLKACRMVNINYKIPWPINIILRDEHMLMYKELFQFILMIKWALYTLNHMYFRDLDGKIRSDRKQPKIRKYLIVRLNILRFGLVNVFSSIQHYVLGHIFAKHLFKFKTAFEEAYDLESLISAHTNFIGPLHKECITLRDYNNSNHGIYLLLYIVGQLRIMWKDLPGISQEELNTCINWYLLCQQSIDPILNPTDYHNYVTRV